MDTISVSAHKVQAILRTSDFTPIVKTLLREGWVKSETRARELTEAFLQWFVLVSLSDHAKPYVMFRGPVDKVFHAFVLNTEYYAQFCAKHHGRFINHNPLDADLAEMVASRGGIQYTIDLLTQHYGVALHPELKRWMRQAQEGSLTASSVSCVGCDYDIMEKNAA